MFRVGRGSERRCRFFIIAAEAAISPRGDLNIRNGTYEIPAMGHLNHGALDYKASTLIRVE